MFGFYVWAVTTWVTALENPTELTTYRSWKVNFIAFWVYAGATFLNIACAINWKVPGFRDPLLTLLLIDLPFFVVICAGVPLVATGIFLGWRIKQLWLVFDPERSLAFQPFEYFPLLWQNKEPEEPKEETDTAIECACQMEDENEEQEEETKTTTDDETKDEKAIDDENKQTDKVETK